MTPTTTFRTYSELQKIQDFEDRYNYLQIRGSVGRETFGFERYLNQRFYTSQEWRRVRHEVIARDRGMDLGVEDHEILDKIIIHHMNPMRVEDVVEGRADILNPDYLISTSHQTHNAIHYGDANSLVKPFQERRPGDTQLWSPIRRR